MNFEQFSKFVNKFLQTFLLKSLQPTSLSPYIRFIQFPSGFIGENLTLEEYTNLSQEERFQLQCALLDVNREWLHRQFHLFGAAWIMVVDGEVVASSPNIDEYPQQSDVLNVCERKGKFPFIFDDERLLLIEESSSPWSATVYATDAYPTADIEVGSAGLRLRLVADLDTGALDVFVKELSIIISHRRSIFQNRRNIEVEI